jgi:hypothetical protein
MCILPLVYLGGRIGSLGFCSSLLIESVQLQVDNGMSRVRSCGALRARVRAVTSVRSPQKSTCAKRAVPATTTISRCPSSNKCRSAGLHPAHQELTHHITDTCAASVQSLSIQTRRSRCNTRCRQIPVTTCQSAEVSKVAALPVCRAAVHGPFCTGCGRHCVQRPRRSTVTAALHMHGNALHCTWATKARQVRCGLRSSSLLVPSDRVTRRRWRRARASWRRARASWRRARASWRRPCWLFRRRWCVGRRLLEG